MNSSMKGIEFPVVEAAKAHELIESSKHIG
jgi:hypothetical protein